MRALTAVLMLVKTIGSSRWIADLKIGYQNLLSTVLWFPKEV